MKILKLIIIYFLMLAPFLQMANAQSKEAARYEIDVKRYGLEDGDREMLMRSREFIRLDPTYYVGYLCEAAYRYERASDYLGFKNCIPTLKKAIDLLEHDFGDKLSERYYSWAEFEPLRVVQSDYTMLVAQLMEVYSNLEYPDSVMMLLDRYEKWDMQRDNLGAKNYKAWTIHRNRFYTKEKYSFLENSVEKNDEKAMSLLHQGLAEINERAELNSQVFHPIYIEGNRLSVYHYLSLIHEYEQNMDSAYYYFEKMELYNVFPYNNFGIFLFVNGDFVNSEAYFSMSLSRESGDKRLKESEYYKMILRVMRGEIVDGIKRANELVRENASAAGWGWYNIALARGFLYNGQLDKAQQHLSKAKNFKELHIGTTWGQSHYDTTIKFLQTILDKYNVAAYKFENKNYLFSPSTLVKIAKTKASYTANQFVLLNQLAANPEREDVFFRLFASECTVTFDEIWLAIGDAFNNKYFVKFYEKFLKNDTRRYIHKYGKYFLGNIHIARGDKNKAREQIDKIIGIEYIDDDYEVLFEARVLEAQAKLSKTTEERENKILKIYSKYPQLLPYSGLRMSFKFDVRSDGSNKTEDEILSKLQNFNIRVADKSESEYPVAKMSFTSDENTDVVELEVKNAAGKTIVPKTKFVYKNADEVSKKLAYAFFNMIEPVLSVNAITSPKI